MRTDLFLKGWSLKPVILLSFVMLIACEKQELDQNRLHEQENKNAVAGTGLIYVTCFSEAFTITSKDALIASRILNNPDITNSDNFTITVRNGKGKTKVTKMEIRIDGELIITYKDFKGNARVVTKNLSGITASSRLDVMIEGSRGRFIEVVIKGISKFSSVYDVEGNAYRTVRVGDQWWMAENLKTGKFNDGTAIPVVYDDNEWLSVSENYQPAMTWYGNNTANNSVYGALYNWQAAGNDNICPAGWRLPDEQDFYDLCLYIDPESAMGYYSGVAGGALKETGTAHWESPNAGATDAYDFTALPGGFRNGTGEFEQLGRIGNWWSDNGLASMSISYDDTTAGFSEGGNEYGRSIRCIKD